MLREADRQVGRGPDQFGFIHYDLSFSNVLFTAREAIPLDFDECGFGHYLQDLAVALAGPFGEDGFQDRYEATVRGRASHPSTRVSRRESGGRDSVGGYGIILTDGYVAVETPAST